MKTKPAPNPGTYQSPVEMLSDPPPWPSNPCFFRFPIFLALLCDFPSFSKDFWGFREERERERERERNPCLFRGFPCFFFLQKSKSWRVRFQGLLFMEEKV